MIRKLVVVLLVAGVCLMGVTPVLAQKIWSTLSEYEEATGNKIEKFNEAPMLSVLVAAGLLPPVEERLPEEPFVVEPYEEIGQYGGTLNIPTPDPVSWWDPAQVRSQHAADYTLDLARVVPSIYQSWEYSEDQKDLTIHLRKGMKWSDGHPFTAEDFLFWYEDVLQNEELTPIIGKDFMPGGELMRMEAIDPYTVRLRFAVPYQMFATNFARWFQLYHPKHYVKKWHINYNPKANELAKEEGYDYWWQAFQFHNDPYTSQQDPNLPTTHPWVLKERTPTLEIFVRNPYFYKIDTAGNQLPYIDEEVANIVGSLETINMKIISGEVDITGMPTSLQNYPLYKENEEKGDYRTLMWKSTDAADCSFALNLNHEDPVLRKIFQDVRFRRAMSVAINRDEVNEIVYRGVGVPCQGTVLPTVSYYKEEWGKAYAEYDPKKADALLDEMGLTKRDTAGFRLRPDGETLAITIEYYPIYATTTANCELVAEYWNAVGVKTGIKSIERSFYQTRSDAGALDVGVWCQGRNTENVVYFARGYVFNPADGGWEWGYCRDWQDWFQTDGKEGEEPPGDVKELNQWFLDWFVAATPQEYTRLAQKIFDFQAENVWIIGVVGMAPWPIIVKNDLRNVPEDAYFGCGNEFWTPAQPGQWFFKK